MLRELKKLSLPAQKEIYQKLFSNPKNKYQIRIHSKFLTLFQKLYPLMESLRVTPTQSTTKFFLAPGWPKRMKKLVLMTFRY